jgi:hypothetical protein
MITTDTISPLPTLETSQEDSFDKSKTNRAHLKQAKACQNERRLKSTLQIKRSVDPLRRRFLNAEG